MDKRFVQEIFFYLKKNKRNFLCFQDIELIYGKIYHKEMSNYCKLVITEELLEDAQFNRTYVRKFNKIITVFAVKAIHERWDESAIGKYI